MRKAVGVLAVMLGACGGPQRVLPAGPPVIEVSMLDYSFKHPPSVPSGLVVFRARNEGTVLHRLSLVVIPEDFPPLREQLTGDTRRFASTIARTAPVRAGGSGSIAVELEAGRRYGMVCFIRDREGVSHARRGMSSEFRAGGHVSPEGAPAGTPAAPPQTPGPSG